MNKINVIGSTDSTEKSTTVAAPGKVLVTGGYLVLDPRHDGQILATSSKFYTHIIEDTKDKNILSREEWYQKTRDEQIGAALNDGKDDDGLTETFHQKMACVSPRAKSILQSERINRTSTITLISPQFHTKRVYKFRFNLSTLTYELLLKNPRQKPNAFIDNCLLYGFSLLHYQQKREEEEKHFLESLRTTMTPKRGNHMEAEHQGIVINNFNYDCRIVVEADNDFYSPVEFFKPKNDQANDVYIPSKKQIDELKKCDVPYRVPEHKTGLGSSAALVTSLLGGILHHFGAIELPNDRDHLHAIAQYCHCLAQGKIGSGFDVSSATYGSQRYIRFDPELLQPLLSKSTSHSSLKHELVVKLSTFSLQPRKRSSFELPPHFQLIVGDVQGGSETPGMVKKVLKWRKENPVEAKKIWADIQANNHHIATLFEELSECASQRPELYIKTLDSIASGNGLPTEDVFAKLVLKKYELLRKYCDEINQLMQSMGDNANVDIVPDVQLDRLKKTTNIPGVAMVGVPGAGGYDAIYAIVISPVAVTNVTSLWHKEMNIIPLSLTAVSSDEGVHVIPHCSRHRSIVKATQLPTNTLWKYLLAGGILASTSIAALMGYWYWKRKSENE